MSTNKNPGLHVLQEQRAFLPEEFMPARIGRCVETSLYFKYLIFKIQG